MWKLTILLIACSSLFTIGNSFLVDTTKLQPIQQDPVFRLLNEQFVTRFERQLEESRADAAEYLDEVLALLREQLIANGYTQIDLPDLESKFSKKILGVTFHGSASLKNGWIRGLETIHRTGPATLDVDANGDILIEAKVGVSEASIRYDMKAEFMGLGPSATVTGKLTTLEVIVGLRVNVNDFMVTLNKFDVKNTGFLTVNVDGLGSIFDFVVEIIIDLVGNTVKRVVLELLEGTIKNLLNNIIKDFLFPPTAVKTILAVQQLLVENVQH